MTSKSFLEFFCFFFISELNSKSKLFFPSHYSGCQLIFCCCSVFIFCIIISVCSLTQTIFNKLNPLRWRPERIPLKMQINMNTQNLKRGRNAIQLFPNDFLELKKTQSNIKSNLCNMMFTLSELMSVFAFFLA